MEEENILDDFAEEPVSVGRVWEIINTLTTSWLVFFFCRGIILYFYRVDIFDRLLTVIDNFGK